MTERDWPGKGMINPGTGEPYREPWKLGGNIWVRARWAVYPVDAGKGVRYRAAYTLPDGDVGELLESGGRRSFQFRTPEAGRHACDWNEMSHAGFSIRVVGGGVKKTVEVPGKGLRSWDD